MGDWTGSVPSILPGDIPTGVQWKAILDELTALSAAWITYNPAWSSTGTQPAIGNGTLTGSYMRVGKLVHVRVALVFGSTTTPGTGIYIFLLPVAAVPLIGGVGPPGSCYIFDSGVTNRSGICFIASTTTIRMVSSADADITAASQTWSVGDMIHCAITYEAA